MKPVLQACWSGARLCARGLLAVLTWTLWLALTVGLVAQIIILTKRELSVPAWVRHRFEQRLERIGLRADVGKLTFDPEGRVLLEDVALSTPALREPLVTARAVYLRIDPWMLLAGHFEATELDLSGGTLRTPTLLSPSGRNEAVVSDLAATLTFGRDRWSIDTLTGRVGRVEIALRGGLRAPTPSVRATDPTPQIARGVQAFLRTGRRLLEHFPDLERLDSPRLEVELEQPEAGTLDLGLQLTVDRVTAPAAWIPSTSGDTVISGLRASTRLHLTPGTPTPVRLDLSAGRITGEKGLLVRSLRARLDGQVAPDRTSFTPVAIELGAAETRWGDIALQHVTTRTPFPVLAPDLSAIWAGRPWSLRIRDLDRETGRAVFEAEGELTPEHLALADRLAGRIVSDQVELQDTPSLAVAVRLGPGWKPSAINGRLEVGAVTARTVPLDGASATFSLQGTALRFDDIVLRVGQSIARGNYEMDTETKDFRFLLEGRLQPASIAGWFRDWWPRLWSHFDFSKSIPTADVDVSGRWGEPELTTVFVAASNGKTGLRGTQFDTARTRVFVRPQFYDVLHFNVTQGERYARGTFARRFDLEKKDWRSMEFDAFSNLDLVEGASVIGPEIVEVVAPFRLTQPAQLRVSGRFDGPAAPGGPHRKIDLGVYSKGPFTYYDFPISDLNAAGQVRDDDIVLDPISVGFAGGVATGRIHLSGTGPNRRLGFDYRLSHANLGESIRSLEEFGARRRGEPVPKQNRFQEKIAAGQLDVAVSADGRFDDLFSYRGQGNAELTGADLGEVRLLWVLSQVLDRTFLDFSTLKLDTVQANFAVAGSKLAFSEVRITGPRAAIEAQGDYLLDRKTLDMKAKLFPFEESRSLFGAAAGLVLSPFSQAFEFKLTGPLDKPSWTFVYGPTNFLRTITGSGDKGTETPAPPR